MEKQLRSQPETRWRDYIPDLTWSRFDVEPAELSEISETERFFESS